MEACHRGHEDREEGDPTAGGILPRIIENVTIHTHESGAGYASPRVLTPGATCTQRSTRIVVSQRTILVRDVRWILVRRVTVCPPVRWTHAPRRILYPCPRSQQQVDESAMEGTVCWVRMKGFPWWPCVTFTSWEVPPPTAPLRRPNRRTPPPPRPHPLSLGYIPPHFLRSHIF